MKKLLLILFGLVVFSHLFAAVIVSPGGGGGGTNAAAISNIVVSIVTNIVSNTVTGAINTANSVAFSNANVLYVGKDGTNSTAIRGRQDKKWLTISNALSFVQSGDTVVVFPGTYAELGGQTTADETFTNRSAMTLYGRTNVSLIGIGKPEIYVTNVTTFLDLYGCKGVTIDGFVFRGMRIPGTAFTNVTGVIDMRFGTRDVTIKNCDARDINDHVYGVFYPNMAGGATNIIIDDTCTWYNVGTTSGIPALTADGACVQPVGDNWYIGGFADRFFRGVELYKTCKNITVNMAMRRCWSSGVIFVPGVSASDTYATNILIVPRFSDCENIGNEVTGVRIPFGESVKVHGGYLLGPGMRYGVSLSQSGISGVDTHDVEFVGVTIGDSLDVSSIGIRVDDSSSSGVVSNIVMRGNTIRNLTGQGVYLDGHDLVVDGNYFLNTGTGAGNSAIDFANTLAGNTRNRVINNKILGHPSSVSGILLPAGVTNVTVRDNFIGIYASQPIQDANTEGFNYVTMNSTTNQLFTGTNATASTYKTVFNSNVGVKTNIPGAPFHVGGGGRFEGIITNNGIMPLANQTGDIGTFLVGFSSGYLYRLTLIETNDDRSEYITITAPDTVTSSYVLTLPPTNGVAGQVLTNNGSGILNWSAMTGGSSTPGGTNKQVQFNDGSTFSGATNVWYDKANLRLGVGTNNPTSTLHIQGNLQYRDGSEAAGSVLIDTGAGTGIAQWWQSTNLAVARGFEGDIPFLESPAASKLATHPGLFWYEDSTYTLHVINATITSNLVSSGTLDVTGISTFRSNVNVLGTGPATWEFYGTNASSFVTLATDDNATGLLVNTNWLIFTNRVLNIPDGGFKIGPSGAILTNVLPITAATLDFPSTTANSVDLAITVTGAADGDFVTVAPPVATMTGLNGDFTGFASNNTVFVRFTTPGATIDPASGSFRVKVEKFR